MDKLPQALLLEILSRLNDSSDIARCRLASKTFDIVSRDVRSINLQCSLERYIKSRSRVSNSSTSSSAITPFKTIFLNLVSSLRIVESVSIGAEKPLRDVSYDDVEDESDDLYLTDGNFVNEWLPRVCGRLKSISISDFWVQSCWRRSSLFSLVSSHCHNLLELEVKNAWLSMDNLNPMPMLTSLTLEFVRLDDEDLNELNKCFPSLQVLNLIGVGGLKAPKVHLLSLKTCHWTVSNAPLSLSLITPSLVTLKLECVRPSSLYIEAPVLSHFHLALDFADQFDVKGFDYLKTLSLRSPFLCNILSQFPFGRTVKNLTVDSRTWSRVSGYSYPKFTLEKVFTVFPNVSSLMLNSSAWSELEACNCLESWDTGSGTNGLKTICAYLLLVDPELTFSCISFVMEQCIDLSDVSFLIHRDVVSHVSRNFMTRSMAHWCRVNWRWGMWKEGMKDAWISCGI